MNDLISRQAAIEAQESYIHDHILDGYEDGLAMIEILKELSSAEPERVWHPVGKPPAHHKDVIVRGIEAIGNVVVYKVMQWDVDTWRPTDYAPSVIWKEWSEI